MKADDALQVISIMAELGRATDRLSAENKQLRELWDTLVTKILSDARNEKLPLTKDMLVTDVYQALVTHLQKVNTPLEVPPQKSE